MLQRTQNAALVNSVANHPDVLPGISLGHPVERLDTTPFVEDSNNVILFEEHGMVIFHKTGDGVYDVHVMFLPSGRGPRVARVFREAIRMMFDTYGAKTITAIAPNHSKHARTLTKRAGFKPVGPASVLGHAATLMTLHKD